jgi:hypothetical protein
MFQDAHGLHVNLWWHATMFHLERGNTDRVLALYDSEFRNPTAKLIVAQPDLYIDVQNAASMLFRLQRLGVDVGDRWVELADKAEARIRTRRRPVPPQRRIGYATAAQSLRF